MIKKQMAYMLGRQQIFLELDEETEDYDELVELMSNSHLNNNFLALAREVCVHIIILSKIVHIKYSRSI